jgi:hypothetical protein
MRDATPPPACGLQHGALPACATGRLCLAVAVAVVVAGVLGWRGVAEAQYLAVFVDGRLLKVDGAALVGASRIRLDLPGGGSIEIPLARLDRVIADEVEAKPAPIPEPSCRSDYAGQALSPDTPFAAQIRSASKRANLSPVLVAAVVEAESAFKPWAVSRVGAGGLMQLMPSVWLEQGIASPYDPAANLRAGCHHLRTLLDRFGDLTLALAAYNAGIATVVKSGGVPPYRETRDFVRRVYARYCPERPGAGAD